MITIHEEESFSIKSVLDIAPGGVLIIRADESMSIAASNEKLWRLFECDSEEDFIAFCDGKILNLVAPMDREGVRLLTMKSMEIELQARHHYFYRIVTKSGREVEIEDCGGLIYSDKGTPMLVCQFLEAGIGDGMDVSDRLTGVLNIQQFTTFAKNVLDEAALDDSFDQYVIIFNNIRNFKFYNMKYGRAEGDRLLKQIADDIQSAGNDILVARASADHFVTLSKNPDMIENVRRYNEAFNREHEISSISMKSGIYRIVRKDIEILHACDMAKIACDAIRDTSDVIMFYNSSLERKLQLEKHIIEHFDEALKEGYIKPYYQPVIRTITNTVCGTEALARWIDPEIGFISPADFIPILEEHNLITRLDLFILEQVCINMSKVQEYNHLVQPTSFNLSKRDFAECNMLEAVENIVSRHGIARDMIHIEITESMVMDDPQRLKREIDRFQKGGYQVWMDDFGSGYSSLNVLKEYPFDEIKLDMFFLRSFDEKSREMLRSSIRMAKNLGIQTLAEGVETREQYEFLRDIGCEKVQGYYFSKPLPAQEVISFAEQKNLKLERRSDRHYYDAIGRVNRDTDRSLCIVEYDQKNFRFLYRNQEFVRIGASLGIEQGDVLEYLVNAPSSTLSRKFRYFQDKTKLGEEFAEMDFSVSGQYFRLRSRKIAENGPLAANQVEIFNFSNREIDNKSKKMDAIFREMYSMYDIIFLIHPDGQFENLMRSSMSEEQDIEKLKQDGVIVSLDKMIEYFHPDDRKEFLEFADIRTLRNRLMHTERGFETRYLRSRFGRNGYTWKSHTMQYIPENETIIYTSKMAPLTTDNLLERLGASARIGKNNTLDDSLLEGLKYSETINFFWKDKQRRFLGGSKKFFKTFGITDESVIVGKTDQDFHWVLDDGDSLEDDIQLLEKGTVVHEKIEKCVIQGVTHTILTSKEPIYKGDEIVGLLCEFIDVDELLQKENGFSTLNYRDQVTGLLSAQGIIDSVYGYIEGRFNRHENFAIIRVKFLEQKRNYEEYGSTISNKIAQGVANELRKFGGSDLIIARLYAGNYTILKKYDDKAMVDQMVETLTARLKSIHEIGGYDITIYPQIETYYSDQIEDTRTMISIATGGTEEDLKERRQLEDKLDYYDIQLETIVDAIPGGITIMEIHGDTPHMVYASKGVAEMSGRTQEEFLRNFEKGIGTDLITQDAELLMTALMEAVRGGTDLNITYRIKHVNGNLVWTNMQGRVIGEQNGYPLFLSVFRNLSESTSIYEAILDASQEYIMVKAKVDGEILYANNAAIAVSNRVTDGVQSEMYDLVQRECTPEKASYSADEFAEGRTRYEIIINNKNLLVYYVDGVWNGREATICYTFDITARYTEERARAARESLLYFEAINSSYDLIVTYNLTRNNYNSYCADEGYLGQKWDGYETYDDFVDAIIQMIPADGTFDRTTHYVKQQLERYYSGTRYAVYEHEAIDADGDLHWVSDRVVYAKDPETNDILAISLTMIIDDEVRERNEKQNILREALKEANSANEAKSRFLSNMSHDIRTPMNAIMGYASIAKDHMDDHARVADSIDKILYSGRHLEDLINDVLDMSRIESGKDVIDRKPTQFGEMAQDVIAIIDPLAKEKNIVIESDLSEIMHMNVLADMTKIRRVMVNILSNAVKFTGVDGRVQCKLTETKNKKSRFGTYRFSVKDNGVGMAPEFVDHIFDLFARERNSTMSHLPGSGLGMAIAKRYVDLMGGTIEVTSRQGEGTEVVVTLDLEWDDTQKGDLSSALPDQSAKLIGKHVLVVDDNRLNRNLACIMLEDMGMITDTAVDGKVAVDKLENCRDGAYDIVLMDMQMPEMDGVTATKMIRASKRAYLREVPIIAITANAFTEDVKACLNAGMNAHIAKPFSKESFIREISRVL